MLAPGEVELAGGGGTGYGLSAPTRLHTSQGSRSPASTLVWEKNFTFWKSSAKSAQVQSWPTRLLRLQHLPLSVYLVTSYLRKCECFFSSNIPLPPQMTSEQALWVRRGAGYENTWVNMLRSLFSSSSQSNGETNCQQIIMMQTWAPWWSLKDGSEKKVIPFVRGVGWGGLLEEVILEMSLKVGIRIIKGTQWDQETEMLQVEEPSCVEMVGAILKLETP